MREIKITNPLLLGLILLGSKALRDELKARCDLGRKERKRRGERIGQIPLGYSLDKDGKTLLDNIKEQQAIVIAKKLREEGKTLQSIATELNNLGFLNKAGKRIAVNTVYRMVLKMGV